MEFQNFFEIFKIIKLFQKFVHVFKKCLCFSKKELELNYFAFKQM